MKFLSWMGWLLPMFRMRLGAKSSAVFFGGNFMSGMMAVNDIVNIGEIAAEFAFPVNGDGFFVA